MLASVFNYIWNKKPTQEVQEPNASDLPELIPLTTTANGATTLSSSGDALVNLFYGAVRGANQIALYRLADKAAQESLLYTLKIIAYIRDIRGGKGEREIGRMLFEWLTYKYDAQLAKNMWLYIDRYGRYDDMVYLSPKTAAFKEYVRLLGQQLRKDVEQMEQGQSVSLVAKWIPSEASVLNKDTDFTYRLARSMKIGMPELRKKYLTPLRKYIGILEQKMCSEDWPSVDYNVLPSQALNRHTAAFKRNDLDKYQAYLDSLKSGEGKVNVGALHPHEVVKKYLDLHLPLDTLVEKQWEEIVGKAPKSNMLVLSDVSSSMNGLPMLVSITMGILIASCSTNPDFKNKVLTFESQPQFVELTGSTLHENVEILKRAPWGGSTNVCAAFDAILSKTPSVLSKGVSVDKLIIVSDMQFNKADSVYNDTVYEVMKKKFSDKGITMPHVIFWNVNGQYSDFQTTAKAPGVSMVSGFSLDILESIIDGDDISPFATMMRVLNKERYADIQEVV